jgi:predicted Zn-dependent peptidase
MFENEEGDAFARYAKTGASANAYTSFDKTAYLFSCTDRFEQSLEILLDFVRRPYFTKESVQKEQGIIGQEIRMYDDSGDWRVFFNLLGALYVNHPVRIDIAGTVDSIAKIDHELLYRCYRSFL